MGCGRSWRGQKLLSILDLTPIAFWHRRLAIKLEMVALLPRQVREWPVVGIKGSRREARMSQCTGFATVRARNFGVP